MKFLNKIKDGLNMVKDKTIEKIYNIGIAIKDKENRLLIGIVLVSLGGGLILSCYVKVPQ